MNFSKVGSSLGGDFSMHKWADLEFCSLGKLGNNNASMIVCICHIVSGAMQSACPVHGAGLCCIGSLPRLLSKYSNKPDKNDLHNLQGMEELKHFVKARGRI